jgi:hypothetical protein
VQNTGILTIADEAIVEPGTFTTDWRDGLESMAEADVLIDFNGGSPGAKGSASNSITAYLQTSLDLGETAIDLWSVSFTTPAGSFALQLKPNGRINTPSDGAMQVNKIADGIVLGDRLRLKYVVEGTYAENPGRSSRLKVRAHVR